MRRFLACAGVIGRPQALEWLRAAVDQRKPDGVLFVGGVLDNSRRLLAEPPPWTHEEGEFVVRFFETLSALGVFAALIPGPGDLPLERFLRLGMNAEIDFPKVRLAHATLLEEGEIAACGIGGRLAGGNGSGPSAGSRTFAEYHLRALGWSDRPVKVLLLPAAPTGALGGEEGTVTAGELIDSLHPDLCVVNGTHEHRGFRQVARTLVVNPGWLAEGSAALVDLTRSPGGQVELLNFHALPPEEIREAGTGD